MEFLFDPSVKREDYVDIYLSMAEAFFRRNEYDYALKLFTEVSSLPQVQSDAAVNRILKKIAPTIDLSFEEWSI